MPNVLRGCFVYRRYPLDEQIGAVQFFDGRPERCVAIAEIRAKSQVNRLHLKQALLPRAIASRNLEILKGAIGRNSSSRRSIDKPKLH